MQTAVDRKIEYWKKSLMDLGRRNPLINRPEVKAGGRSGRKVLRIDEDISKLWKQFYDGGKPLTFPVPPAKTSEKEPEAKAERNAVEETAMTLRTLQREARVFSEEKGLNNLYLAFGFLRWKEKEGGDMRSPLVLVPVTIGQENIFKPFLLNRIDDEITSNPALSQRLLLDFGIRMPVLEHDNEDLNAYLDSVEALCASDGWCVERSTELSLFSFLKINMYRDVEANAEKIRNSPLIRAIAGEPVPDLGVDPHAAGFDHDSLRPSEVFSVVDADSSQQDAIFLAKQGKSFILQGPPGTGKSQTITNIIAELLADRKRVLFVSEKMAALEVVEKRLSASGLGEFCLTLHNHNAKRSDVIEQLKRSLDLTKESMRVSGRADINLKNLGDRRGELNQYVREIHTPRGPLGITIYQANGEVSSLSWKEFPMFGMDGVEKVSAQDLDAMMRTVRELSRFIGENGWQRDNPWYGTDAAESSYEFKQRFAKDANAVSSFTEDSGRILRDLGIPVSGYDGIKDIVPVLASVVSISSEYKAEAFSVDSAAMLARFRNDHDSFFGKMKKEYKADMGTLASFRKDGRAVSFDDAVALLDKLSKIRSSEKLGPGFMSKLSGDDARTVERLNGLFLLLNGSEQALDRLRRLFVIEGDVDPDDIGKRADRCLKDISSLERWTDLDDIKKECNRLGLDDFLKNAELSGIGADDMVPMFKKGFYSMWLDSVKRGCPSVRDFRRSKQDERVREFRELDSEHMKISRDILRKELAARLPSYDSKLSDYGEYGVLKKEMAKKRKFLPIRKLIEEMPALLPALKPCMMMSPLSVSTYLGSSKHRFDAVIFDEASQVRTEDAIGAIFRGDQVIIAGDSKQMPPTNFFARMTSDDEAADEETEDDVGAYESLLDEASLLPNLALRWHYRSRHEHLIAFSNAKFYHGDLTTFPSAAEKRTGEGVEYVHVHDGVYEKQKGNRNEARKVAELVFEHFRTYPKRSLGVIAFGDTQQSMIENEVLEMRKNSPEFEVFFKDGLEEAFFIKNLETVQGDERDSIIFSIGYAPDPTGRFKMFFGPLNLSGGERRLNVAITRARYSVKLVGSILPTDIDADSTKNDGPKLLRQYIDFAMNGTSVISAGRSHASAPTDSLFEDSILTFLDSAGYGAATQVGCSGYRIDLAVRHPQQSDRYVLGIECDGANYSSARTARDRDRLRRSVLEGMGWKMYRVWSTDWTRDPKGEGDRLIKAVEEAIEENTSVKGEETDERPKKKEATDHAAQGSYISVTKKSDETPRSKYYGQKVDAVPMADIADMMVEWLKDSFGMTKDELYSAIMRSYGWTRKSVRITEKTEEAFLHLRRSKVATVSYGKVVLIKK